MATPAIVLRVASVLRRIRSVSSALLLLSAFCVGPLSYAGSTEISLLRDFSPGAKDSSSSPALGHPPKSHSVTINGIVYFPASHLRYGRELWRTDGTPGGTWLVKDIMPGASSSGPTELRVVANKLVFIASSADSVRRIWISDGTSAGTKALLGTGGVLNTYLLETETRQQLFFATKQELWRVGDTLTDTTLLGRFQVLNFATVIGAGEHVFFIANDYGTNRNLLWGSDGTPEGTIYLAGFRNLNLWEATTMGTQLYFPADDGVIGADGVHGLELWRTDGTPAGTQLIRNLNTAEGSNPQELKAIGNRLYFSCYTEVTGRELCVSDGTEAGTKFVRDINPGPDSSNPDSFTATSNGVIFGATIQSLGRELWRTNGTGAGTVPLKDLVPGSDSGIASILSFATFQNKQYFSAPYGIFGQQLWVTDGSAENTHVVLPATLPRDLQPSQFLATETHLFFAGFTDGSTWELWATDGTRLGTRMVRRSVLPTNHIYFSVSVPELDGIPFQSGMLFKGHTGTAGNELWFSDGTPTGTALVKDINFPGFSNSTFQIHHEVTWNGRVYFAVGASANADQSDGLWVSDASTTGTVRLFAGNVTEIQPCGNFLCFAGYAATAFAGRELWRTDGTVSGTILVRDIVQGSEGSFPHNLRSCGAALCFSARHPQYGEELWRTDGTFGNTVLLKDINPGPAGTSTSPITAHNGLLYFAVFSDISGNTGLWRSNGTQAGTFRLSDKPLSFFPPPRIARNLLFFIAQDDAGTRLTRTDGTVAGTTQVTDKVTQFSYLSSSMAGTNRGLFFFDYNDVLWFSGGRDDNTYPLSVSYLQPRDLTAVKGGIYFTGFKTERRDVWFSDGTHPGTRAIENVLTPSQLGVAQLDYIGELGDDTILNLKTGSGESGLWRGDGASRNLQLLKSDIQASVSAGGKWPCTDNILCFSAATTSHGQEWWRTDGTAQGTTIVSDLNAGPGSSYPDPLGRVENRIVFSAHRWDVGRELFVGEFFLAPGDIDGNGSVNSADLAILMSYWGQNHAPADLNNDGIVDQLDLSELLEYMM